MKKNTMFRTECYGNSGVRDAKEIFLFETLELCNTDILETIVENGLIKNQQLLSNIQDAIEWLDAFNEGDGDDFADADIKFSKLFDSIIDEIAANTGKRIRYALWLASAQAVKRNYEGDQDGRNMDEYYTSEIILSDLGADCGGILFGYESLPKPI